jgi:hypothetical protein
MAKLSTVMYLETLEGVSIASIVARFGVAEAFAVERIEAARLCYEHQVEFISAR